MTAHELARVLLAGPDRDLVIVVENEYSSVVDVVVPEGEHWSVRLIGELRQ